MKLLYSAASRAGTFHLVRVSDDPAVTIAFTCATGPVVAACGRKVRRGGIYPPPGSACIHCVRKVNASKRKMAAAQ